MVTDCWSTNSHCFVPSLSSELEESLPRISPDGYNASLNEGPVEFTCIGLHGVLSFTWIINGTSSGSLGDSALRDRGIKINRAHIIRENNTVVTILVQPKVGNENTTLQCVAFSQDFVGLRSEEVLLQIQGL